jgi:predicted double-glycine peptidase
VAALALFVAAAAMAGAWLGGRWLAATDRRLKIGGVACTVLIGAWFYAYEGSDVALRLVPWDDCVFFDRIPLYLAILLLLCICYQRLERGRRLLVAVMGLFGAYALAEVGAPLAMPLYLDQLDEATNGSPEVHQSTGWSCGAAALAWAMRLKGIPASERQMAELAVMAPLRGTKVRGMLRAIHRMGLEAQARRRATWDDLSAAPLPALAGWRLSLTLGHVVVVIRIEGGQVVVGDPLLGEVTYSRQEFLRHWDRALVVMR